jgi:excisionase family DNA binding protein
MKATTQQLAVSTRDAARMLSVSRRTIQSYITTKVLRVRKIGRRTVIPVRSLEEFLQSDHASPSPKALASTRIAQPMGAGVSA